jgi:predicted metal-dependent hydrolase
LKNSRGTEEWLSFGLGAQALQCRLRRSPHRRSLSVRVSDAGEVVVNAPLRLAQREIHGFLHKHADWINSRLQAAREHRFEWQDGALLPYLGGHLTLRLLDQPGPARARQDGEALLCNAPTAQAPALVLRWYQRNARALLGERLAHHVSRAGLPPPPLRLSNARTRWGSLSATGVVSLNWRLLKARPEQIDYVICHELAHFRQRNHSPAFWREVETLFPDWKKVRGELRQHGRLYFQF